MEVILEEAECDVVATDPPAKTTAANTTSPEAGRLAQQRDLPNILTNDDEGLGGQPPPAPPPTLASAELLNGLPLPPKIYQILPETFKFSISPEEVVPSLIGVPLPDIYPLMCQLLGAPGYELNLATFWFIDIIAEALLVAQSVKRMSESNQKTMIAWFGRVFKNIQENVWSREELFANLRSTVMAAGEEMFYYDWQLLAPEQLGQLQPEVQPDLDIVVTSEQYDTENTMQGPDNQPQPLESLPEPVPAPEPLPENPATSPSTSPSTAAAVEDQEELATLPLSESQEKALLCDVTTQDMITIMELLYGGFANAFTHGLVYNAFCNPGSVTECILPDEVNMPKKLKPPPPPPPKPPKPPKEKKGKGKGKKDKKDKGGKKDKNKKEKSDKSEKSGKSGKGDKKSDKSGKKDKKDKSEKGGKKGGKDKTSKGSKKGGKKEKKEEPEVVEAVPEVPPNPLLKYLPPPFDPEAVAVIAANNKMYVNRLQDACPTKFFEDVFPVAVKAPEEKQDKKDKGKGKKDKKGKENKKDKKDKKGKGKKK